MRLAERADGELAAATDGHGTFTLSLDFELLWGTVDLFGPEKFRRICEIERELVIGRLLRLLEEFEISATWCVLGHLLLDSCRRSDGLAHHRLVRPQHAWIRGDWFQHDPCSDESRAPLFYARSVVEMIRACRVPQEIGSHSFSHAIFSDPGCSEAAAASELRASVDAAAESGLEMHSFAFPRNGIGHLHLLPRFGFTAYRGPAPRWYERRTPPTALQRLARLWSVLIASAPPVVVPEKHGNGPVNIPASMMYFPMHGRRRHIPVSRRVRRARKGLDAAIRAGRVFHLWLHPTNLADQPEAMFSGLREVLAAVRDLRDRGQLSVQTMRTLASHSL
jgi:peptidoglycan/xylan/chitin deacetylase (PgdA/CDA1 family)